MTVIKRIAPLSAAKIVGLIYALVGLPFALLVWVVSLVGFNSSGLNGSPFAPLSPGLIVAGGAAAAIVLPIIYGVFGFVMTFLSACLYNFIVAFVGGLSIEVEMDDERSMK